MSQRTILLVFTLLTTLTIVPAWAGWHRSLGLGWSDGYHSHTGCAPCQLRITQPRYQSPEAYYSVPAWLHTQPTPAQPESIAPVVPAPESRLPSTDGVRYR